MALLYGLHSPLAARVLPLLPTALFLGAITLMQISQAQAAYLRAHKREPFLIVSLSLGILTGAAVILLGWKYGAAGMAAGFLAVVALVGIPLGTWILHRCRSAWHARSFAPPEERPTNR